LNIRLTVLVVETARLERRGVNDNKLECFPLQSLMFVCKARTGAYTRWKVVLDLGEKQTL
jgi:hypothetical protein